MQINEIYIYSTQSIVRSAELDYPINTRIIVNLDGSLELGLIKNKVESDSVDKVEFVRLANNEDYLTLCKNCRDAKSILPDIKREAEKLNLDMKIGFVAYNLDKTKLTVNYTADGRIDFRELVKTLGAKYKVRIEMKQIGYRDEAKIIGALGVCGRETCCKSFLSDFDKVSIKMAKNQGIALNPSRINGMCGRLLCCLKYEDEYYAEQQKKMPKINSKITTPDGLGIVDSVDIFKEIVNIKFEKDDSTEVKTYILDELIKLNKDRRN